ncbi:MAG: hypothetical protein IKK43_03575 [Clostridia bacterium]|nr:hypothetical protein [Clostridia bacterium]
MQKNNRAETWRLVISLIATVVMLATVVLQITINNHLIHIIGCAVIVLLLIPLLILDKKCSTDNFITHLIWLVLWVVNLGINCIYFIR